ncbi:MAG: thermonuclease family protein [Candidatus Nitrosocaldus sp.]
MIDGSGLSATIMVSIMLSMLLYLHHSEGAVGRSTIIDLIVVEYHHPDAEYTRIRVVDGDTVRLLDRGESLRLVGYDAYELREPLGYDAKAYLQRLCSDGSAYVLIDKLEPRDRFGRLLGYLWCRVEVDGYTAWVSVQRAFLASDLIKSELYIKPDLYPYWVWRESKEIRFEWDRGRIVNGSIDIGKIILVGSDGIKVYENTTSINVPAGVYKVCLTNDSCMLINTLDGDEVYRVNIDRMIVNGYDGNSIHVRSVEGSRMVFIRADIPSLHIDSIRVVADDGFIARVKVVTDNGRMITSTLRDSSDHMQIDSETTLIKIYMVKKGSREVCIEGLSGRVILNDDAVDDRPCIRLTR